MITCRAAQFELKRANESPAPVEDTKLLRLVLHKPSRNTKNRLLQSVSVSLALPENSVRLPLSFTPSDNDVIIGTGREARNHVGHQNLIKIIRKYSHEYSKLTAKSAKGMIITKIIEDATRQSPTGTPFVKAQNGRWFTVEREMVREKVSQSMRNLLHSKYKSSTTNKKHKRVQNYRHFDTIIHAIMQKKGNFITERMGPLYAQRSENSNKTDEELCELFTQANLNILESLKSFLQEKKRGAEIII